MIVNFKKANGHRKLARHVHQLVPIGHYHKSMKTSKDQKYGNKHQSKSMETSMDLKFIHLQLQVYKIQMHSCENNWNLTTFKYLCFHCI